MILKNYFWIFLRKRNEASFQILWSLEKNNVHLFLGEKLQEKCAIPVSQKLAHGHQSNDATVS